MNVPDKWVILEFDNNGKKLYKVFAGWYGGYLDGDSWKLNSGIVETTFADEMYVFKGYSGSEYHCAKDNYGISMLMSSILVSFQKQVDEAEGVALRILSQEDVKGLVGIVYCED